MKCGRAGAWHAAASVVQNVPADTSRAWSANARRRFDIGVGRSVISRRWAGRGGKARAAARAVEPASAGGVVCGDAEPSGASNSLADNTGHFLYCER